VITVRPEEPDDFSRLRELQLASFAPSELEADIADALRAAGDHVPELCLVAVDGDVLVGHVMLSKARVDGHPAIGLGPIAVDPARQREGIGDALMREAIDRATKTDYPLIALLGHPTYYPRFGFQPAEATFGISSKYDAPPEAWMALALPAYEPHIRGRFRYAEAFG
jgi:putative acetyltransferase